MKPALVLAAVAFCIPLVACSKADADDGSSRPYKVGVVDRGEVRVIVEETGVVSPERSIVVKSPISGVVQQLYVREGDRVQTGQVLARIVPDMAQANSLAQLLVKAAINEVDIGKVTKGDRVALTVDAFPGDTAQGVVRLVPPAARLQDRVRVFDVEVEVTGGARVLRPGMTANVRISGPVRTGTVRVPVEAVLLKEGKPVVYKLGGSGPQPVSVTLGLSDLYYVEILNGLAAGDSIALEDPAAAVDRARNPARRR